MNVNRKDKLINSKKLEIKLPIEVNVSFTRSLKTGFEFLYNTIKTKIITIGIIKTLTFLNLNPAFFFLLFEFESALINETCDLNKLTTAN